jgi:hypothetical protein
MLLKVNDANIKKVIARFLVLFRLNRAIMLSWNSLLGQRPIPHCCYLFSEVREAKSLNWPNIVSDNFFFIFYQSLLNSLSTSQDSFQKAGMGRPQ